MRRLAWIAAIASVFGTGLAAGLLLGTLERKDPADRGDLVADFGRRIASLERRLREPDSVIESLQARLEVDEAITQASAAAARTAEAVAAPVSSESSREPREAVDEAAEKASPPADDPPSATEEDAMALFRRFLEKTVGMGWQQRMQHGRALLRELREMGEPAVTALLAKLEEGEDVRERGAAARLLGERKGARPALQSECSLGGEERIDDDESADRGGRPPGEGDSRRGGCVRRSGDLGFRAPG